MTPFLRGERTLAALPFGVVIRVSARDLASIATARRRARPRRRARRRRAAGRSRAVDLVASALRRSGPPRRRRRRRRGPPAQVPAHRPRPLRGDAAAVGELYLRMARELLEGAGAARSPDPLVRYQLAEVLHQLRDDTRAVTLFETVVAADSTRAPSAPRPTASSLRPTPGSGASAKRSAPTTPPCASRRSHSRARASSPTAPSRTWRQATSPRRSTATAKR